MQFASTLPASIQGTSLGGTDLEVPPVLVLTCDKLPLPLMSTPVNTFVDLRGTQSSAIVIQTINQPASTGILNATLCTFDKGLYRLTGTLYALFLGGLADSSADPTGAVLQLVNPAQTTAFTIMFTGAKAATSPAVNPFDYTLQFNQTGWLAQISTFHNTGVGQSIGVSCSLYAQRLM